MAFANCTSLVDISIPDGVNEISDAAFLGCTSLTSVSIPNSITTIGNNLFSGCKELTTVFLNNNSITSKSYSITTQGVNDIFGNQVANYILGEDVTDIGERAFYLSTQMKSISIPKSVKRIRYSAFEKCNNLEKVIVDDIASWCGIEFGQNSNPLTYAQHIYSDESNEITELVIPDGVNKINAKAFYGCKGIKSVTFRKTLKAIGNDAFYGCEGLNKVIAEDLKEWCNIDFGNYYANPLSYAEHLCLNQDGEIFDLVIPEKVECINNYAFVDCTSLTSVSIPSGITSIGDCAFNHCIGLTSISIPNTVISIGGSAFSSCTGLISIEIPNSVKEMWTNSFSGCNNIKTVTIDGRWKCYHSDEWSFGYIDDFSYSSVFGTQVEKYILGDNLQEIQSKAFKECTNLKEITIPKSIQTIEEGAFSGCNNLTTVNLDCDSIGQVFNGMASIQTINFGEHVKKIGNNSFVNCTGLKNCIIPNNITSVGINAFGGCTSLSNVILSNRLTTLENNLFSGCSSLSHIEIPDNISNIGFKAFNNSGLQTIIIPNGVSNIDYSAFEDCKQLSDVTFSNSVQTIGRYAFRGCENLKSIIMPNGLKKIASRMFQNCSNLKFITIPESVTSIEEQAFNGCSNLSKVIISNIDAWCNISFDDDSSNPLSYAHHLHIDNDTEITDLVIPEGVENVNDYAFYGGSNLKSVTIPSSLKTIGTGAFNGCEALSKVIVPDILSWCNIHFGDNPLWDASHLYSDSETEITDLTIPYGVNKINSGTFKNASSIMSINLPNSLTEIGGDAFYGCSNLKSLTLPNGIEKIGSYAFYKCSSLEKLVIPNSVKSIDSYAFGNCLNLYSVTSLINLPFKLNESAFSYSGTDYSTDVIYLNATLYVPRGKLAMYMLTEGWQKFINVMETDTKFILTYVLDGEVYKTYEIQAAEVITPEPDPYKAGYIFSGWSEIPYLMPAQNVTVTGNFTVDPNSGIEGVSKDETISKDIYTIDGLRTNNVKRGLNIIRMNNGTTRKVMVK